MGGGNVRRPRWQVGGVQFQDAPPIRECEGSQVIFNTLFCRLRTVNEYTRRGPRESASRPSAPDPANKSMTRASSSWNPIPWRKILNSDSRVRSEVGRVSRPEGADSLRPLQSPPTMRTGPVLHGLEPQLLAERLLFNFLNFTLG